MRRPDQADYRRVLPPLLNTFEFRSNNEAHQPVIQAVQPPRAARHVLVLGDRELSPILTARTIFFILCIPRSPP